MLYVTSNDSTHLIQHRTVIAVGKSLHGHVRLVVADHNLHVAPDEQSPAILGPIDLVRHVIPIWHVVHPEGHVGPVGNLLGVVRVKAGGVRVEAPGVGRLVDEPNGAQTQQLAGVGMRVRAEALLLLQDC